MSDNYWKVTLDVTLELADDVSESSAYNLYLNSSGLTHGKWASAPPSEISIPSGSTSTTVTIEGKSKDDSLAGVKGEFVYKADDSTTDPTTFTFKFNDPTSGSNSSSCTIGGKLGYFDVVNGEIPDGDKVHGSVTITQTGPT